jgi:hypothetical protein
MTLLRQVEANRGNAIRSTSPKTEDVCLGRPARIEDERHDRERGALRERRRHFGIGAQCLDRA